MEEHSNNLKKDAKVFDFEQLWCREFDIFLSRFWLKFDQIFLKHTFLVIFFEQNVSKIIWAWKYIAEQNSQTAENIVTQN